MAIVLSDIDIDFVLFGDVNAVTAILRDVTASYRLLVGAAEELSRTPEVPNPMIRRAIARADHAGTVIDCLIKALSCELEIALAIVNASPIPLPLLLLILAIINSDDDTVVLQQPEPTDPLSPPSVGGSLVLPPPVESELAQEDITDLYTEVDTEVNIPIGLPPIFSQPGTFSPATAFRTAFPTQRYYRSSVPRHKNLRSRKNLNKSMQSGR